MRMIWIALGVLAAIVASIAPSAAQYGNTTGFVVSVCGTPPSPFVAGRPGPFTIDTTGTLCSQSGGGGGGGTSSTFGAAFPATGTAAGFFDGTNMAGARVTSGAIANTTTPPTSGVLLGQSFNMFYNGTTWDRWTGLVNAAQSGTWNITNISGTISLPTGASTSANQTSQITQETAINTVLGTTADAAAAVGGTGTASAKMRLMTTQLDNINTNVQAPLTAGTNRVGYTSDDPCNQLTKLGAPINLTASGQLITGTAAKKTYICAINFVTATAQNIALVEGTGSTCATNIFGLAGGTTAATGWNWSANGGIALGGGSGTVVSPSGDANGVAANVCLLLSGTGQTSGQISYVQQ